MKSILKDYGEKFKESLKSILPFFTIILALYFIFMDFNVWSFLALVIATLLMIVGMALFSVGVDMSTMKMGGYVGSNMSKSRKISFMIIYSFILGFIVTIAEPDLMVLAEQVPGISSKWIILITVSAGTGIFLALSTLKTLFRWNIKTILIVCYVGLLILACLCNANYVPLAFDCEGITTGPVSVPFIMSFGLGVCAVRSGKNNQEDGFGLIALASVGPALAIFIVSMFLRSGDTMTSEVVNTVSSASAMGSTLGLEILSYLKEVFIVILPIFVFFLVYNFMYLKLPKKELIRIFIGIIYTYVGLVLFLTGVASGYLPTANELGGAIASSSVWWVIIPLGFVIGFFLVFAEPAVHVLNKQVEDITEGIIKQKTMQISISIGVAIAVFMSVLRAVFEINFLYFLIPLIVLILVLSFFAPSLFVSIGFDSGGTAAGALSCSFVLPFVIGIASHYGYNTMLYAFGTVGFIALMPVVVIEIMGIRYSYVKKKSTKVVAKPKTKVVIYDFE